MKDFKQVTNLIKDTKESLTLDSMTIHAHREGFLSELERLKEDLQLLEALDMRENSYGGKIPFLDVLRTIFRTRRDYLKAAHECFVEWNTGALTKDELQGRIDAIEIVLEESTIT